MENIETKVIDTTEGVAALADWLVLHHEQQTSCSPIMYIDLEGVNLCREGSLSIVTLLIDLGGSTRGAYLIDVHRLGEKAFNTAGLGGKTLKDILQDETIPKVFYDVRNDSDALFAHYSVALRGVEDVQLMESATRKTTPSRRFLSGLARCIENHTSLALDWSKLASWKLAKEHGARLFRPELGGSYEVFNQRPIPGEIVSYCVGDVQYLPELRHRFWSSRSKPWQDLIIEQSARRVAGSQRPDYQPNGPHKALAPWSEEQNRVLDQWNYML